MRKLRRKVKAYKKFMTMNTYKQHIVAITALIFFITSLPTPSYSISKYECAEKIAPYKTKLEAIDKEMLQLFKDADENENEHYILKIAKLVPVAMKMLWVGFRLSMLPDECNNAASDAMEDALRASNEYTESRNRPPLPTGPMPEVCDKYIAALHEHVTRQITTETILADSYIDQGPNPLLAKYNDSYGYTQDFWTGAMSGNTPYECIPFVNVEILRLKEHSKAQSRKLRPYRPEWSSCQ